MITINVAADFSRYPAGRDRDDGPFSGQAFREDMLEVPLRAGDKVTLMLDGTRGYGSSFLEEVFGGLVRCGLEKKILDSNLVLETNDDALRLEIRHYIEDAVA